MLLLATLEGGPRHGYAVREALRQAGGTRLDIPTGTIYPALRRLEASGLVTGTWTDADGRRRRCYQLTPAGHRKLAGDPGRLARVRLAGHRDRGAAAVPGNPLISAYLAALHRRLPPSPADEVADGLLEAYQHHLGRGEDADAAARAAIAETGDVAVITAEFTRHAPGRRTARLLLATSPVAGACWGTALISTRAWTWPVPPGARIAFAAALLAAIAGLALAAASRHGYRQTRLTAAQGWSSWTPR